MKYCEKCKVQVGNPVERCPLCYAALTQKDGAPEEVSYPDLYDQAEKYNIIFRILLFLSITACTVCVTINYLSGVDFKWSIIVIANILYMWIAISTAVRRHAKLGFNIMVQVISLAVLLILLDYFSGNHRWALNYVVPLLFITAMLSITIIIIVRRVDIGSFILYFILIGLLGFIPIILWALQMIKVLWPSLVAALYSAISLVSIFIFADNATKIELKKRFHV